MAPSHPPTSHCVKYILFTISYLLFLERLLEKRDFLQAFGSFIVVNLFLLGFELLGQLSSLLLELFYLSHGNFVRIKIFQVLCNKRNLELSLIMIFYQQKMGVAN
jgi:hypothetical protein